MRMSRLLASVTNPSEARTALELGADIVDCKDPSRGALGDLDPATIAQIVSTVGNHRPVSATVGDLPTNTRLLARAIRRTAATGVDYVKIGLFETRGVARILDTLSPLARRHRLIAVLFADRNPRIGVLPELAAADFSGVMLDTAKKGTGGLLDSMAIPELGGFVAQARRHRLLCGLAGSLRQEHIPALLPLGADYLGFRGALCAGQRTGVMDPSRFRRLCQAMRASATNRRDAA